MYPLACEAAEGGGAFLFFVVGFFVVLAVLAVLAVAFDNDDGGDEKSIAVVNALVGVGVTTAGGAPGLPCGGLLLLLPNGEESGRSVVVAAVSQLGRKACAFDRTESGAIEEDADNVFEVTIDLFEVLSPVFHFVVPPLVLNKFPSLSSRC